MSLKATSRPRLVCKRCEPVSFAVWSPSGGWWCKPVNWQRNTKLAAVAIFPVACYIFATSVDKEVSSSYTRKMLLSPPRTVAFALDLFQLPHPSFQSPAVRCFAFFNQPSDPTGCTVPLCGKTLVCSLNAHPLTPSPHRAML